MKALFNRLTRYWFVMMATGCVCYVISCTKPADVVLPPHQPRLVLHGYIETGDTFRVALGKTIKGDVLIADTNTYVHNGWVVLYENDVFLDSLRYNAQERRYVSATQVAAPGKTYKIRAGASGFPSIETVAQALFPVNTVKLEHLKYTRRNSSGYFLDDVKFSFNDPPAERNFYWTAIYPARATLSCVYTYDPSVERFTSDLAPFDQGDCIDNDELLYNDKLFNGSLKEITISTDAQVMDSFTDGAGKVYKSYIKRYHISEAHYLYIKSSMNQGTVFEEGPSFSEPVVIKGNVANGYGLFSIYSVTTDTLR